MPALLTEATGGSANGSPRPIEDAISVLIVTKDHISRAGVERQLLAMPEMTVLPPSSGRHPDVALVVADAIDDEVLSWIRKIRKISLSRIVVVAGASGPAAAAATAEAGANGLLPRTLADGRRLAWAIHKAHRGEAVAVPGADERVAATPPADDRGGDRGANVVSDRDREVLRLLAEGCDTGEIARTLAYSEPTIKNVIQRLFEQLKAKNRPHAVALALRSGII
jgi:DNA-binding NarL/FixJ family response regulator